MLQVNHLSVAVDGHELLRDISFDMPAGAWMMIAGPNGAGKSTLISALSRGVPYTGEVLLRGKSLRQISPIEQARAIGVLAQRHEVSYSFCVEEIVALGRYAHSPGIFSHSGGQDARQVEEALRLTGLWEQRGQSVLTLSGGELQRMFLAQVLAQEPSILMLDEPTNHLDIQYQARLFSLIDDWLCGGERAVLSVVHDLGIARRYGNRAMLLQAGRVAAKGEKELVFSRKYLEQVYQMDVFAWMKNLYEPWLAP